MPAVTNRTFGDGGPHCSRSSDGWGRNLLPPGAERFDPELHPTAMAWRWLRFVGVFEAAVAARPRLLPASAGARHEAGRAGQGAGDQGPRHAEAAPGDLDSLPAGPRSAHGAPPRGPSHRPSRSLAWVVGTRPRLLRTVGQTMHKAVVVHRLRASLEATHGAEGGARIVVSGATPHEYHVLNVVKPHEAGLVQCVAPPPPAHATPWHTSPPRDTAPLPVTQVFTCAFHNLKWGCPPWDTPQPSPVVRCVQRVSTHDRGRKNHARNSRQCPYALLE